MPTPSDPPKALSSKAPFTAAQVALSRQGATRRLTFFYITSLSAIACLALLGQFMIQRTLTSQALSLQIISTLQTQKATVPPLTRTTLDFKRSTDPQDRAKLLTELQESLQTVRSQQQKFSQQTLNHPLSAPEQAEVQPLISHLQSQYQQLMDSAQAAIDPAQSQPSLRPGPGGSELSPPPRPPRPPRPDPLGRRPPREGPIPNDQAPFQLPFPPSVRRGDLDPMQRQERAFMREADKLLQFYNQQITQDLRNLKTLEIALLSLTLGVLLLEGLFVFRPAVQNTHDALQALTQALQEVQTTARQLDREQRKSEQLLLNILPASIAQRLKQKQESIADGFEQVTVLFADLVGFTQLSTTMPPQELVMLLNQIFSEFDQLVEKYSLEKIKTIGDAYMVVGGVPTPCTDHAIKVIDLALEMQQVITRFNQTTGQALSIRIGINSGPVVAGVIGIKKFIYDLWGDTVNTASRMESHGKPGAIQITAATYDLIKEHYQIQPQGTIAIKGKGEMKTYFIIGKNSS